VADKPRLTFGQLGSFRRSVRLRFFLAAVADDHARRQGETDKFLEDAILWCAWARAFAAERDRRRAVLADIENSIAAGAFNSELRDAPPEMVKAKAHEVRALRRFCESPHKMRRRQKDSVTVAAEDILAFVQEQLRSRFEAKLALPILAQHELWFLQQVAVDAWFEVAGKKSDAKKWQKAVANEHPLTICYDRPVYDFTEEGLGRVAAPDGRWGCGKIVPDSTHVGGDGMFRTRCDDCNGDVRKPRVKAHHLAVQRSVRHT
jgi:hypothetical protein